jgi:ABC-type transport system involved in cytochrome bd biosynthesis fused ATPase/permease subunit
MIIGICGHVGAGKSTTLLGILGESIAPQDEQSSVRGIPLKTTIRIRQITIHEGFAYVGQEAWVRRGTVRDNILCGSQMNEIFYRRVLDATALSRDIEVGHF